MNTIFNAMLRQELQAHQRNYGLWAGLLVVAALLIFKAVDSFELAAAQLVLEMVAQVIPFLFLLAAFITLHGSGREERARFTDVFATLPISNNLIYRSKMLGTALTLSIYLLLILTTVLLIGPLKGHTDVLYWQAAAMTFAEASLAVFTGLSVGMLTTAIIPNYRARYVVALIWLVGMLLLSGLGTSYCLYELLPLFTLSEEPFFFSLAMGFFPHTSAPFRHALVQVTLITLLLVMGRACFLRQREQFNRTWYKAAGGAMLVFLLAIGWNTCAWQQWRSAAKAEVAYHIIDKNSATADWRRISGEETLYVNETAILNFAVIRYEIDLNLTDLAEGFTAISTLTVTPNQLPRLYFTLLRSLKVQTVEYATHPSSTWRPPHWSRIGDFLAVDLPPELQKMPNILLRIRYNGTANVIWGGIRGSDPVQFVNKKGAYLNAQLGWYPLPGGRRLPFTNTNIATLSASPSTPKNVYFHLNLQTAPDQLAVSSLPTKTIGASNTMHGWTDSVSVFAGSLATIEGGGISFTAPAVLLPETTALQNAYTQLKTFYEQDLGIALPKLNLVVAPDWLERSFHEYLHNHIEGHTRLSYLLGNVPVWREIDAAIASGLAQKWADSGSNINSRLWWATKQLNASLQQTMWYDSTYPIAVAASQYMTLLWYTHTLGESGSSKYQRIINEYQNDYALHIKLNTQGEYDYQIAEAILYLHHVRQQKGAKSVGAIINRLLIAVAQGESYKQVWQQIIKEER